MTCHEDGSFIIWDVETGEMIYDPHSKEKQYHQAPIQFVRWFDDDKENHTSDKVPYYRDQFDNVFSLKSLFAHLDVMPRINSVHKEDHPSRFHILMTADENGIACFFAFGSIFVCEIDLRTELFRLYPDHIADDTPITVRNMIFSPNLNRITMVVSSSSEVTRGYVLHFDASVLDQKRHEISHISWKLSQIEDLLSILESNIIQVREKWGSTIETYHNHLKFLENEMMSEVPIEHEFLSRLIYGTRNQAIDTFLDHKFHLEGIKGMLSLFNTSFETIENIIILTLRKLAEMIIYKLSHIRGLSKWNEYFGTFQFTEGGLDDFLQTSTELLVAYERCVLTISKQKTYFVHFLNWLLRLVLDSDMENEDKVRPYYEVDVVAKYLETDIFYDHVSEVIDGNSDVQVEENHTLPPEAMFFKGTSHLPLVEIVIRLKEHYDQLLDNFRDAISTQCSLKDHIVLYTSGEDEHLLVYNLFNFDIDTTLLQFNRDNTSWILKMTEGCEYSISCFDVTWPEEDILLATCHYKESMLGCFTGHPQDERRGTIQLVTIENLEYYNLITSEVNACNGVINYFDEVVMMQPYDNQNVDILVKQRTYDRYLNGFLFLNGSRGLGAVVYAAKFVVLLDLENDEEQEEVEEQEEEEVYDEGIEEEVYDDDTESEGRIILSDEDVESDGRIILSDEDILSDDE